MRFTIITPQTRERKVVSKFLLFPKTLRTSYGTLERRWLEKTTIGYIYTTRHTDFGPESDWKEVLFLDESAMLRFLKGEDFGWAYL